MFLCTLLLSPASLFSISSAHLLLSFVISVAAIPHPSSQWGDFEFDLRNLPRDESGNIITPDQPPAGTPNKFFSDEGVTELSPFSADPVVPNKDNLAFGSESNDDFDFALTPSPPDFASPFPLPIVAYCDSMYTLCSSGKGGDTVGDVKGGITVKNGEQIIDDPTRPFFECKAPRAIYCCTTVSPSDAVTIHNPVLGIDEVHYPTGGTGCNLAGEPSNSIQLNLLPDIDIDNVVNFADGVAAGADEGVAKEEGGDGELFGLDFAGLGTDGSGNGNANDNENRNGVGNGIGNEGGSGNGN